MIVEQRPAKRALGSLPSRNLVLFRRQLFTPFVIGLDYLIDECWLSQFTVRSEQPHFDLSDR
jgi:hypothetical protein